MNKALEDIATERQRQIEAEGFDNQHDDSHEHDQLARAAACYAVGTNWLRDINDRWVWPWAKDWWKPTDRRRDLVKAGALIVAEIERLDRAKETGNVG